MQYITAELRDRPGADSPHAEVVSAAAHAILAPIIEQFGRVFAELTKMAQAWADAFGRAFRQLVDALPALLRSDDRDGD